jgi:hypothetical protein
MSSETLNAENRNDRVTFPVRRCCSFCRNQGHNIQTCNDGRLYEFERLCIINYRETPRDNAFKNWLLQYSIENPNIVKTYAVRFCRCAIRNNICQCVESILIRIINIIADVVEQETPQFQQDRILYSLLISSVENSGNIDLNPPDIMMQIMFMDMINQNHEEYIENRKFNIQRILNLECSPTDNCDCDICFESNEKCNFVKLNCGHEFCKECIKQTLKFVRTIDEPLCALCRTKIQNFEFSSQLICDEFNDL